MVGMTMELWLVLIYLVAMGVADLQASKLGLMVGPIPVFLTDITLFLLFVTSFIRWPSRILYWLSEGFGAGSVGRAVWLVIIMAVVFFFMAVAQYPLYATRDLAIFSYSLFYPLVYFAIRERRDALRLLRYFSYASVIGAALLVLQEATGLDLGLFHPMTRVALGRTFVALRSGDSNAPIFALVFLSVYALFERRLRVFHVICVGLCCFSLAASAARASVIAVLLAAGVTFYCARGRQRLYFVLLGTLVALPVIVAPLLPEGPASRQLENLRLSVISGAGGPSVDGNASFRTRRWQYALTEWAEHPILGIGFGRQIIPSGLVDATERKGEFNVGMPHNSLLFIGARTGLIGFSLILYSWVSTLIRLVGMYRWTRRVELLGVANILSAMFAYAMFGLFIERPGSDATFWIVLSIGSRLLEFSDRTSSEPPLTLVGTA
jgi:O-antigen ligase